MIFLSVNNNARTINEIVAELTGIGYTVVGSENYYRIDEDKLYLTEYGVTYSANSELPTVAISDGSSTNFLVTRRSFADKAFQISEHPTTLDTGEAHVVINGNNVEVRDSTKFPNNEKLGVLGFTFKNVAENDGDEIMDTKLLLTTADTQNFVSGGIDVSEIKYDLWSDADIFSSGSKYYISASDYQNLAENNTILTDSLAENWTTTSEGEVLIDLNGFSSASFQSDISIKVDGTTGDNTRWKFYSDTADSSMPSVKEVPSPYLDVSFSTDTPVKANNDSLSIIEGRSNLLSPFNITENDTLLDPSSETQVISVEGIDWVNLNASTSDLYAASFDYKEVQGEHGILYIRPSGKVYYEHDGSDISEIQVDTFGYTIQNSGMVSEEGELQVSITPENQAPTITLEDENFHKDDLVSNATVVASYELNDPDDDSIRVELLNGGPKDTNGDPIYSVDPDNYNIKLTSQGAVYFENHSSLPEIIVVAIDSQGADTITRSALHVAQGKQYFVDQNNGADNNSGLSLNNAVSSFNHLISSQLLAPGDTIYIVGEYKNETYVENYEFDNSLSLLDKVSNDYVWRNDITLKIDDLHGEEGSPITIKGWDSNSVILNDANAALIIDNSSHLKLLDLEISGIAKNLTYAEAQPFQHVFRVAKEDVAGLQGALDKYRNPDWDTNFDNYIGEKGDFYYFYRIDPSLDRDLVHERYGQNGEVTLKSLNNVQKVPLTKGTGITIRTSENIDVSDNNIHHFAGAALSTDASEFINVVSNEIHNSASKTFVGTMGVVFNDIWDSTLTLIDAEATVGAEIFTAAKRKFDGSSYNVSHTLSGKDSDHFTINSSTGVVTLTSDLNISTPADLNQDNVYEVTLVSDYQGKIREKDFEVKIVDEDTETVEYAMIFAGNELYLNRNEFYSWDPGKKYVEPALDEGNGFSTAWQDGDPWMSNWNSTTSDARLLIANNVSYLNGKTGLGSAAARTDWVNNTTVLNSLYKTIYEFASPNNTGIASVVSLERGQYNGENYTGDPSTGTIGAGNFVRVWNNISVTDASDSKGNPLSIAFEFDDDRDPTTFPTVYAGGNNATFDISGLGSPLKPQNIEAGIFIDAINLVDGVVMGELDPLFVDPTNFDFRLALDSPLFEQPDLDTGSWFLKDLTLPDIAFQQGVNSSSAASTIGVAYDYTFTLNGSDGDGQQDGVSLADTSGSDILVGTAQADNIIKTSVPDQTLVFKSGTDTTLSLSSGKLESLSEDFSFTHVEFASQSYDHGIAISDVVLQLRDIVGLSTLSGNQKTAADIDGDGDVAISDVVSNLRHIVGLDTIEQCALVDSSDQLVTNLTASTIADLTLIQLGDVDLSATFAEIL